MLSQHPLTRLVEDYQLRRQFFPPSEEISRRTERGSRDPPSSTSSFSSSSNEVYSPSRSCSRLLFLENGECEKGTSRRPLAWPHDAASRSRSPSRALSRYTAATAATLVAGVRGFPSSPRGWRPNICEARKYARSSISQRRSFHARIIHDFAPVTRDVIYKIVHCNCNPSQESTSHDFYLIF